MYSISGPYGLLPSFHAQKLPTVRKGFHELEALLMPVVNKGVNIIETYKSVDIDDDAAYISEARNRSIISDKDDPSIQNTPENVIKLDAKTSKQLDTDVGDYKNLFLSTLRDIGIPASIAYEEASGELEAIVFSKYGVEISVEQEVLEYVNAILDADILTKMMTKTTIDKKVADDTVKDFLLKQMDDVRAKLKGKHRFDIMRRYNSKYQNMVAETEVPPTAAVRGSRK